jgi:hypothetical protein
MDLYGVRRELVIEGKNAFRDVVLADYAAGMRQE